MAGDLLDLFYAQTDKNDLWQTALKLETLDANRDRRQAAARALGWIPNAGSKAATALMGALSDQARPEAVRETAAESLAYLHYAPSVPILISVLDEPDVRLRFWAVFALGGIGQWQKRESRSRRADRRIVDALERMLSDEEVPPGNWWSVGKEALAMLGALGSRYRAELDRETRRILNDAESSEEDLRWAKGYSRMSNE